MAAITTTDLTAGTWTQIISAGSCTEFLFQVASHSVEVQFGTTTPTTAGFVFTASTTDPVYVARVPVPETTDKVYVKSSVDTTVRHVEL